MTLTSSYTLLTSGLNMIRCSFSTLLVDVAIFLSRGQYIHEQWSATHEFFKICAINPTYHPFQCPTDIHLMSTQYTFSTCVNVSTFTPVIFWCRIQTVVPANMHCGIVCPCFISIQPVVCSKKTLLSWCLLALHDTTHAPILTWWDSILYPCNVIPSINVLVPYNRSASTSFIFILPIILVL